MMWPANNTVKQSIGVVACIGLISDTHYPLRCEQLPPALFEIFEGVDLLLHAGDRGTWQ